MQQARAAAQLAMAQVSVLDFAEVKYQHDVCDLYALVLQGKGWCLKLTVCKAEALPLLIVAFHPLEKPQPIETNQGWVRP